MRVLLVDNHDSYTFNLFQLLAEATGEAPDVVTNDDARWTALDLSSYAAAVISPGPGRPHRHRDVGRAPELLERRDLPTLGVCLGHQMIAHAAGAQVALAPAPRHGHLSRIRHDASGLFDGVPQDFTAVRYHSLCVAPPLPHNVQATAWAEDGVVMALARRDRPQWGVQFHPESIAGQHGLRLVANFLHLATGRRPRGGAPPALPVPGRPPAAAAAPGPSTRSARLGEDVLTWSVWDEEVDTERAFRALHAGDRCAFWLDSTRRDDTGRFSFLGAPGGPRSEVLRYRRERGEVEVQGPSGVSTEPGTVFDSLARRTAARPSPPPAGLPFDFTGGYVGFFGYELKADCRAAAAHRADTPDAVWLRVDRFLAVDHTEGRTYLLARAPAGGERDAERWIGRTRRLLAEAPAAPDPGPAAGADARRWLLTSERDYRAAVKECLGYLAAGESYELCLTAQARLPAPADELAYYARLRRASPAPYAALLRDGELGVLSASPERFLRIDAEGWAESRPIKGTAPRGHDPRADAALAAALRQSAKTRAENLMIVDLLRNDLGRVCVPGSVEVPRFMYTRSYATVHQLISTVRGRLRGDVAPLRAVQSCFPGGSMTGAPKLRTMELLDSLETGARGVYSGALGYVGYEGTLDLSIVIRTAVRWREELRIGAGGAVVLDSDPAQEYEEMVLKAEVPLRGLG